MTPYHQKHLKPTDAADDHRTAAFPHRSPREHIPNMGVKEAGVITLTLVRAIERHSNELATKGHLRESLER
jgi:hypothetical protein